jgi:hypothetical protein
LLLNQAPQRPIDAQTPRNQLIRLALSAFVRLHDAAAFARSGHALAHFVGDLDGGIALIDRALVLNPNLASAWFLGGFLRVWHGLIPASIIAASHALAGRTDEARRAMDHLCRLRLRRAGLPE